MTDRGDAIREGLGDALPLFLPTVPFALVLGIAVVESSLGPLVGWSTSPLVFGGASQLTLLTLLSEGAAPAAAITAALVVNARHLMYSAALAPTFQGQPTWFRWVGPYFLVDQVFALAMMRSSDPPPVFRSYYLTVGATFWLLWLLTTALGIVIGPAVPQSWGLGFAVPVMFTSLLVLGIDRWPKAVAALVAAATALVAADLPNRSGLLLGALTGVLVGVLLERLRQ
jgi:predicted branched-subunit amino acid permease